MISGKIYEDPYSGHEVLILSGMNHVVGAAYDPRRANLPLAFSSECPHCQGKRFRDVPTHLKHEVWMMMTSRGCGYVPSSKSKIIQITVPTQLESHDLRYWSDQEGRHIHIVRDGEIMMRAFKAPNEAIVIQTPEKMPDRKIVHRSLKFIFSERSASSSTIAAIIGPLIERQQAKAKICGYRKVCDKIAWAFILDQIKRQPEMI